MIVKVCGVRTAEIASAAAEAGADLVGVVIEPRSVRHASDSQIAEVRSALRGRADLVGVLVAKPDHNPALLDRLAARLRLDALQIHGQVSPRTLIGMSVPVIPAVNVTYAADAYLLDWPPTVLVMLDADAGGGLPGGTGRTVDPSIAADVARHRPILLAGGLGPDTVGDAIARVHPRGVDASSGLESSPGVKDPARVLAYVRAARAEGLVHRAAC